MLLCLALRGLLEDDGDSGDITSGEDLGDFTIDNFTNTAGSVGSRACLAFPQASGSTRVMWLLSRAGNILGKTGVLVAL